MLQILLSADGIFTFMNEGQKMDIAEIIGDKYEEKKGKCDDFQTSFIFYEVLAEENGVISSNLVSTKIQNDIEIDSLEASGFTYSGYVYRPGNGAGYYLGTYSLYGTSCECFMFKSGDFTAAVLGGIVGEIAIMHPNWTVKSGATRKYNCHSYCWINKSYDNIYWLNDPSDFANATSYFTYWGQNIKVANKDSYIILYDSDGLPAHSVRSISASTGSSMDSWMESTTVESKLGGWGVYETTLSDMFDFYEAINYKVYTKK